jgi:hypothetical protein
MYDGLQVDVLRTLAVVWTHLDVNPAVFQAAVDAETTIEAVLAGEPPFATPADVLAAMRAHLREARVPGRSTLLVARVDVTGAARIGEDDEATQLLAFYWKIDHRAPGEFTAPGPDGPSTYGMDPPPEGATLRALVAPKRHHVILHAIGRVGGERFEGEVKLSVDCAAHTTTRIALALDASAKTLRVIPLVE